MLHIVEPQIINSRQELTNISFQELINDIATTNPNEGYCFYHVLKGIDRQVFLSELQKHTTLHMDIYKRKAILLFDWFDIMKHIKQKLYHFYLIYRTPPSKYYSRQIPVFELCAFGKYRELPPRNTNPLMRVYYNTFGYNIKKTVAILLLDFHMEVLVDYKIIKYYYEYDMSIMNTYCG
jgi:hypothetical protein